MTTKKNKVAKFNTYEEYLKTYFPNSQSKSTITSELSSEEIGIALARKSISKNKRIINKMKNKNTSPM